MRGSRSRLGRAGLGGAILLVFVALVLGGGTGCVRNGRTGGTDSAPPDRDGSVDDSAVNLDSGLSPSDTGAGGELDSGYDPSVGNLYEGPLVLDDARVLAIDPSTLPRGNSPCREPMAVRVVSASDGDTVRVSGISSSLDERVRLIGVDTPEVDHSGSASECYGDEAYEFTYQLVGHVVWLTFDSECRDTFERLLAFLHVGSGPGDLWERQLLRRGYAEVLTVGSNRSLSTVFESDERAAQESGIGRWSACR